MVVGEVGHDGRIVVVDTYFCLRKHLRVVVVVHHNEIEEFVRFVQEVIIDGNKHFLMRKSFVFLFALWEGQRPHLFGVVCAVLGLDILRIVFDRMRCGRIVDPHDCHLERAPILVVSVRILGASIANLVSKFRVLMECLEGKRSALNDAVIQVINFVNGFRRDIRRRDRVCAFHNEFSCRHRSMWDRTGGRDDRTEELTVQLYRRTGRDVARVIVAVLRFKLVPDFGELLRIEGADSGEASLYIVVEDLDRCAARRADDVFGRAGLDRRHKDVFGPLGIY